MHSNMDAVKSCGMHACSKTKAFSKSVFISVGQIILNVLQKISMTFDH